jgi:hypothetical protein
MGATSKKIERRIKGGRDPRCSFQSDHISESLVQRVMDGLRPDLSVQQLRQHISAVKIADEDMTPQERKLFVALEAALRKPKSAIAENIYNNYISASAVLNRADIPEIAIPVAEFMGETMKLRIDRFGATEGTVMPKEESTTRIKDFLTDYVPMRTKLIDEATAEHITEVITAYRNTEGMTLQDIKDRLEPITGSARARAIAITETTRAAAQATNIYQGYLKENGIPMIRVWNTVDNLACEKCGPLDGKDETVWAAEYPDGAPAHVNCRCDIVLKLDTEGKLTDGVAIVRTDSQSTTETVDTETINQPETPAQPAEIPVVEALAPESLAAPETPAAPEVIAVPTAPEATTTPLATASPESVAAERAAISDILQRNNAVLMKGDTPPGDTSGTTGRAVQEIASRIPAQPLETQLQIVADADDGRTVLAYAVYGAPEARQLAASKMDAAMTQKVDVMWQGTIEQSAVLGRASRSYRRHSIEYFIYKNPNATDVQIGEHILASNVKGIETKEAVYGATLSDVMARVGPNADVPQKVSFWPDTVTPAVVNPRAVEGLQALYDQTQRTLAGQGVTSVKLYRGTAVQAGIPVEPWSTSRSVSEKFIEVRKGAGYKTELRIETIPAKYIIGTYLTNPKQYVEYEWQKEYTVLGQAFYGKGKKSMNTETFHTEANDDDDAYAGGLLSWDLYAGYYL